MPLPHNIFAPAFRRRHPNRMFVLMIGIMVYLATFVAVTEAALSAATFTWDASMASRMTAEIPAASDESSTPQAERVRQALAILRAMPGVAWAQPAPDDEAARLLKPWIDTPELLKALPLPTLIDIERAPGSTLTARDAAERLKVTIADARVDDHATWLGDIERFARGLGAMGGMIIFLTGTALAAAVGLMCRVLMASERETIALLHAIGAEDDEIAAHFQFHAKITARPAAFAGFALALPSAGILLFFLRHFADPSVLQPLHWLGLGVAVLLVPLAAIWIAAQTARRAALKLLQAMP